MSPCKTSLEKPQLSIRVRFLESFFYSDPYSSEIISLLNTSQPITYLIHHSNIVALFYSALLPQPFLLRSIYPFPYTQGHKIGHKDQPSPVAIFQLMYDLQKRFMASFRRKKINRNIFILSFHLLLRAYDITASKEFSCLES